MKLTNRQYKAILKKAKEANACSEAMDILETLTPKEAIAHRCAPAWCLWYSQDVIKGRWKEAEGVIEGIPHYAYLYAKDVIKGRWKEVEGVIKKNPSCTYYYAKNVIGGRWEEAEGVIKGDHLHSKRYTEFLDELKKVDV